MHYSWGRQNFQKPWSHFKKTRCQKSEIQEVFNLKFRHCLGCPSARDLKISEVRLSPHRKLLVTAIDWHTWTAHSICVLEAVRNEIQTVVMETTKRKVLSVSKSVVRYQKYVHMKACLGRRYIRYILESNPHPNLICTSFCRFLKRKKS